MLVKQKIGVSRQTHTFEYKRSDSPRPRTPLGHFRTDIPSINEGTEIVYLNEQESDDLEDNTARYQETRIEKRLQRFESATETTKKSVPAISKKSYSIDDLTRILMFNIVAETPGKPKLSSYTPVTATDSDEDENDGLSLT